MISTSNVTTYVCSWLELLAIWTFWGRAPLYSTSHVANLHAASWLAESVSPEFCVTQCFFGPGCVMGDHVLYSNKIPLLHHFSKFSQGSKLKETCEKYFRTFWVVYFITCKQLQIFLNQKIRPYMGIGRFCYHIKNIWPVKIYNQCNNEQDILFALHN